MNSWKTSLSNYRWLLYKVSVRVCKLASKRPNICKHFDEHISIAKIASMLVQSR